MLGSARAAAPSPPAAPPLSRGPRTHPHLTGCFVSLCWVLRFLYALWAEAEEHTHGRTGHRNSTQRDLQPPPGGPPPHSDQPGVPRQPANLQPSTPGGRPAFITKLITFLLFGLDSNVGSPRESPVCSPSSHGAPRFREPRSFPGLAPFGTRGAPAPSTTKSPPLLRRPAPPSTFQLYGFAFSRPCM